MLTNRILRFHFGFRSFLRYFIITPCVKQNSSVFALLHLFSNPIADCRSSDSLFFSFLSYPNEEITKPLFYMQMVTISNTDEKERLIVKQIQLVIDQYKRNEIDRDELKDKLILFAQSSGFIDNQHRKLAWNYLVDQSSSAYSSGLFVCFSFEI